MPRKALVTPSWTRPMAEAMMPSSISYFADGFMDCEGGNAAAMRRMLSLIVELAVEYHATASNRPPVDDWTDWRNMQQVVAASTGNHGAAVAFAARLLKLRAHIFVPRAANLVKLAKITALGAMVTEHGADLAEASVAATEYARSAGAFLLNAIDPDVPAGAGTIADELCEDLDNIDAIYAPVGDSALIRGVAARAKALRTTIRIIGVQAETAPAYYLSWRSAAVVPTTTCDTIADGLATRLPVAGNVQAIRRLVDEMCLVTEEEILSAISILLTHEHIVAEPAGAATTAAVLRGPRPMQWKTAVLLVTGSNIAVPILQSAAAMSGTFDLCLSSRSI